MVVIVTDEEIRRIQLDVRMRRFTNRQCSFANEDEMMVAVYELVKETYELYSVIDAMKFHDRIFDGVEKYIRLLRNGE